MTVKVLRFEVYVQKLVCLL